MNRSVYGSLWTGPLPPERDEPDGLDWVEPEPQAAMEAEEFRTIRQAKCNLSQYQLAEVLGYASNPSINRFDTGSRRIPVVLARLMRMFGKHGIPKEFFTLEWRERTHTACASDGPHAALQERLRFMERKHGKDRKHA